MEWTKESGLSKREWELQQIVTVIKNEDNDLICIGKLEKAFDLFNVSNCTCVELPTPRYKDKNNSLNWCIGCGNELSNYCG